MIGCEYRHDDISEYYTTIDSSLPEEKQRCMERILSSKEDLISLGVESYRKVHVLRISIIGLSCPKCKKKITDQLKNEFPILHVTFDGENGTLYSEVELDFSLIKSCIETMGTYWVEEL